MSADAPAHRRRRVGYAVLALYVACLVAASVVPAGGGAAATGPLGAVGADKWLHLAGYAGLAAATAAAVRAHTRRTLVAVALFAVVVGAGVEAVQATLPYRSASAGDGLANAVGAGLGALGWRLLSGRGRESREG